MKLKILWAALMASVFGLLGSYSYSESALNERNQLVDTESTLKNELKSRESTFNPQEIELIPLSALCNMLLKNQSSISSAKLLAELKKRGDNDATGCVAKYIENLRMDTDENILMYQYAFSTLKAIGDERAESILLLLMSEKSIEQEELGTSLVVNQTIRFGAADVLLKIGSTKGKKIATDFILRCGEDIVKGEINIFGESYGWARINMASALCSIDSNQAATYLAIFIQKGEIDFNLLPRNTDSKKVVEALRSFISNCYNFSGEGVVVADAFSALIQMPLSEQVLGKAYFGETLERLVPYFKLMEVPEEQIDEIKTLYEKSYEQ